MNGSLAVLAFIALYCFAVWRWARDFRTFGEPWLRRRVERLFGVRVDLVRASRSRPTDREWVARGASGTAATVAAWLSVLITLFVVFLPVACLALAARYHAISWRLASALVGISMMGSCIGWLLPRSGSRESE